jgi:protein-disulfide isomerase
MTPLSGLKRMVSCATGEMGSTLVARDIAVAKELAVSRTPTLFVNGRRAPPPHSEEDLRLLLEREPKGTLLK